MKWTVEVKKAKTEKLYVALWVDLEYTKKVASFDKSLCQELLGYDFQTFAKFCSQENVKEVK